MRLNCPDVGRSVLRGRRSEHVATMGGDECVLMEQTPNDAAAPLVMTPRSTPIDNSSVDLTAIAPVK